MDSTSKRTAESFVDDLAGCMTIIGTDNNWDILLFPPRPKPCGAGVHRTNGGNVSETVQPDGRTLTYVYDAANYLTQVTDNLGNKVEYAYDLKGNRTVSLTKDPDGSLVRSIQTAYDIRNRATQINNAGSLTSQVFDALGNLTNAQDPNGNPTAHSYDSLSRLLQTVDALSGTTLYGYDRNDRLNNVQAPNGATTGYETDDLGNQLKETSPDRGTLAYTHDDAGNTKTVTDARNITATDICINNVLL